MIEIDLGEEQWALVYRTSGKEVCEECKQEKGCDLFTLIDRHGEELPFVICRACRRKWFATLCDRGF